MAWARTVRAFSMSNKSSDICNFVVYREVFSTTLLSAPALALSLSLCRATRAWHA